MPGNAKKIVEGGCNSGALARAWIAWEETQHQLTEKYFNMDEPNVAPVRLNVYKAYYEYKQPENV